MKITVDHVVLEVKDVEASARFYESLLGFPPVRLEAFLAGSAPFASARVNRETIIDLFPKAMWKGKSRPSNPNHVCFTMNKKQVDALKRRMKRRQVPILRRLSRSFGAQGITRSIYFEDPDRVTLEARYYPAPPAQSPRVDSTNGEVLAWGRLSSRMRVCGRNLCRKGLYVDFPGVPAVTVFPVNLIAECDESTAHYSRTLHRLHAL